MIIGKKEAAQYMFKPYEPCPCESGENYKFCCYEKSKVKEKDYTGYSAGRIKSISRKYLRDSDFKKCQGFDISMCSDESISAHSLQNNGVLDQIAENNHVYHMETAMEEETRKSVLQFALIGKNNASTFYGFCKFHDELYFKCIEDKEYIGSAEQHYAYAFRAICLETHKKIRQKKALSDFFRDHPHSTRDIHLQFEYHNGNLSIRDYKGDYDRFKSLYESNDYDQLETFSLLVPEKVGFAATTAIGVGIDMNGDKAADVYNYSKNIRIPYLYISVIPMGGNTLILVTRFKEDECYNNLFKQLKLAELAEIQEYVSFCLAEYSENVFYSPLKIRELTDMQKENLCKKFFGSISPDISDRIMHRLSTQSFNLFELFKMT